MGIRGDEELRRVDGRRKEDEETRPRSGRPSVELIRSLKVRL